MRDLQHGYLPDTPLLCCRHYNFGSAALIVLFRAPRVNRSDPTSSGNGPLVVTFGM